MDLTPFKYTPEGIFYYKHIFDDELKPLLQRINKQRLDSIFSKLHTQRLTIRKSKFDHLQHLVELKVLKRENPKVEIKISRELVKIRIVEYKPSERSDIGSLRKRWYYYYLESSEPTPSM